MSATQGAAAPLQRLEDEHRVVECALSCLEELATRARAGSVVDPCDASDVVVFLTAYADGLHHVKEEHVLFPALEHAGHGGLVTVLFEEHETGRSLIRRLGSLLDELEGTPGSGEEFARLAFDYALLLRDHIRKEDELVFPLAAQALGAEGLARLGEEMPAVERDAEPVEPLLRVLRRVCRRCGVDEPAPAVRGTP